MSDDRDEARRSTPPSDAAPSDSVRPEPDLDDTLPGNSRLDDTLPGDSRLEDLPAGDSHPGDLPAGDARRADLPAADARRQDPPAGDARLDDLPPADSRPGTTPPGDATLPGDATRPGDATLPVDAGAASATAKLPPVDDATRVAQPRPDATSVMPAVADDWAPSRANPAWSGRAEVRPPRQEQYADEWSTAPAPEPAGRWWMPIVVGTVIVILLGVLAWAIYLIVQNADNDESPTPGTTTSAVPTATTTTATTPPSTAPTTSMITTPPTTNPTLSEIVVPALKGLSEQEATDALNRKGLEYRVIYLDDERVPPGTVIDSDPAEGQEVPPDTRITLVVSADRATTTPTSTSTTTGSTDGPGPDND